MKNRIRVERAELRITQQHLADVVGVSRQTSMQSRLVNLCLLRC